MYNVRFRFEQEGLEPVMLKKTEAGYTLLELALANNIELHHNCGGICACTTCHLYIEKGMEHLQGISKREKDFIEKVVNRRPGSRLGCQSLLKEGKGEIEVIVPHQGMIRDRRNASSGQF